MKNICILVPASAVLQSVCDPRYAFAAVNQFLPASGKQPLFDVKLAAETGEVKLNGGLFSVHPDLLLHEVKNPDLIIIPALSGDMQEALDQNKNLLPWIREQYEKGAEVASLCVGAFLLAATGLLEGKKCSTHWLFANDFRNMFPGVELVDGSIVTEQGRIYSSGGANSYWNLLLYLVEKYAGRDMAILAAKYFAIDIDRHSQAAFTMFKGRKKHPDEEVRKAQKFIEENFTKKITTEDLAGIVSVGRRSFERRFKKATGNTVLEYIQLVKIEAAKRSFEAGNKQINEVMYDVGYADSATFRSVFKKITNLTPVAYREKYSKLHLPAG